MSKYQIVLDQLGLKGLKPKAFNFDADQVVDQVFTENEVSMLGTPVFSRLIITDKSGTGISMSLDTVVIDITGNNNIAQTPILGKSGTFKEFLSEGDFSVTIKGAIINEKDNTYPTKEVSELISLCQAKNSLDVSSPFLSLFKIYNLVVNSYEIRQSDKQGYTNIQTFSMTCTSDKPVELL
ncbi:DUF6046 domain-containing protein [Aureibacter tunicatorum]|uniref:DUF6046 domain-containing protein n=1 Tax=Aureibacter tunicatorum TaxID=866807 RepID=A0AAE4BVP3_9BACT|nr:DUF6046 domain-containing protein [Aureibacter tunicatorum]MDR6241888.1 hypothetical protein [Aureibacter tunicatorum]BDD07495.1 hypothetical protein AUTU_49780 [Aureibacter tunicatorum]